MTVDNRSGLEKVIDVVAAYTKLEKTHEGVVKVAEAYFEQIEAVKRLRGERNEGLETIGGLKKEIAEQKTLIGEAVLTKKKIEQITKELEETKAELAGLKEKQPKAVSSAGAGGIGSLGGQVAAVANGSKVKELEAELAKLKELPTKIDEATKTIQQLEEQLEAQKTLVRQKEEALTKAGDNSELNGRIRELEAENSSLKTRSNKEEGGGMATTALMVVGGFVVGLFVGMLISEKQK